MNQYADVHSIFMLIQDVSGVNGNKDKLIWMRPVEERNQSTENRERLCGHYRV